VLVGFFIFLGAGAEALLEQTKSSLSGHTLAEVLMRKFTILSPNDTLDKAVQTLLNGQENEFIISKNNDVVGILTRQELIRGLTEYGKMAPISKVLSKDFLTFDISMPLNEVYQKLVASKCTIAPVNHNSKFVGIIDKENIDELIMIDDALKN